MKIFIFSPNDIPSKTIKNVFYFIEKALYVLKIIKFLTLTFIHNTFYFSNIFFFSFEPFFKHSNTKLGIGTMFSLLKIDPKPN